jgi:pyruvate kinase
MRRAKIVATIGPASGTAEMIRRLVDAGADVFRLNFSHGTHEIHERVIATIRQVATERGCYIPIIGDIQGPKIRIGEVDGVVAPAEGSQFVISTRPLIGTETQVSTPFAAFLTSVQRGHRILINDGLVELVVDEVREHDVVTTVRHSGPVSSRKGMNFPDTELKIPAITEKDREDVRFAVAQKLDYIAASFIQRKEDIEDLRRLLREAGGAETEIIAKIEKAQAIESLDEILEVSDGVMVARGDLGVELPPEKVPIVQKRIISWAGHRGRIVITATQMLESMTTNSRPTRAEASDVANAIFDGSDAVMLSAETASGAYPVEAVEMMARIVEVAEGNADLHAHQGRNPRHQSFETDEFTDALAGAARYVAEQIGARYVVVFTQTGFAARLISKFRPSAPIIGLARSTWVARRMNLLWGVRPFVLREVGNYHEQIVERVEEFLLGHGMVEPGDSVVILMGSPIYQRARTNLLRVHRVAG